MKRVLVGLAVVLATTGIARAAEACAGCSNPNLPTARAGNTALKPGAISVALNLTATTMRVIHSEDWNGPYVQLDGKAEVLDLPEALEPLVEYYRCIAGEHPDWDEYRTAMVTQGKSLLRLTIDRWGPIATGGFPARLAHDDDDHP